MAVRMGPTPGLSQPGNGMAEGWQRSAGGDVGAMAGMGMNDPAYKRIRMPPQEGLQARALGWSRNCRLHQPKPRSPDKREARTLEHDRHALSIPGCGLWPYPSYLLVEPTRACQ
ncbi:hypothetical protein GCM10023307_08190 [Lysobacter hankyongensis]|uniref:Uncharacterized protein n=1 Tax=Lysobacter hankyongensis TaxID=1176535 RepID=A0ABP9AUE7_9GAMM